MPAANCSNTVLQATTPQALCRAFQWSQAFLRESKTSAGDIPHVSAEEGSSSRRRSERGFTAAASRVRRQSMPRIFKADRTILAATRPAAQDRSILPAAYPSATILGGQQRLHLKCIRPRRTGELGCCLWPRPSSHELNETRKMVGNSLTQASQWLAVLIPAHAGWALAWPLPVHRAAGFPAILSRSFPRPQGWMQKSLNDAGASLS